MRVLVVGDRLKDVKFLCEDLEVNRYEVLVDLSGLNGLSHALNAELDVVLLMSANPGEQTWQKLETLRASGASVPVFVLAARGDVRARVAALDCGADDYLVMPVVFEELRARIRAVLRRTERDQASRLQAWGVAMDLVARRATRKGRSLHLTDREFELLKCLMRRQGEVVSRRIIAQEAWPSGKRVSENTIAAHVARLRRKVGSESRWLKSIRGIGYMLRRDETLPARADFSAATARSISRRR
jgi:DNA-binding response OmpR family regulator